MHPDSPRPWRWAIGIYTHCLGSRAGAGWVVWACSAARSRLQRWRWLPLRRARFPPLRQALTPELNRSLAAEAHTPLQQRHGLIRKHLPTGDLQLLLPLIPDRGLEVQYLASIAQPALSRR